MTVLDWINTHTRNTLPFVSGCRVCLSKQHNNTFVCRRRDTELLEVRVQGPVRTANPLTGFGVLLHDSFCLLNEVVFRTGVCTFSVLQRSVSGFEVRNKQTVCSCRERRISWSRDKTGRWQTLQIAEIRRREDQYTTFLEYLETSDKEKDLRNAFFGEFWV